VKRDDAEEKSATCEEEKKERKDLTFTTPNHENKKTKEVD
jgi:hypothetical protein